MVSIDTKSVILVAGATVGIALFLGLALSRARRDDIAVGWLNGANLCYLVAVMALIARPPLPFALSTILTIVGAYLGITLSFIAFLRAEDRRPPYKGLLLVGALSIAAQCIFSELVVSEAPLVLTSSVVNSAVTFWMARTVWRLLRRRGREIAVLVSLPFAAICGSYFLRLLSLAFLPLDVTLTLTVVIVAVLAWSSIILALGLVALRERQAQRALKGALARAEAASEAKSRFLHAMSHELRTPLNAVMGLSELMRTEAIGAMPDGYRRFSHEIHRNGARLLELVSDLLDIADVSRGAIRLDETEVDLHALLREVGARYEAAAAKRGVAYSARVEPGAPQKVRADGARLGNMLSHLVGNAVKYAPENGRVAVRLRRGANGGARFSVKDDGPGLSEKEIAVALELFGRIGGVDDPASGAGVGLTLAAEIARAHGSPLRIKSGKGAGASISVALPAARTSPETEPLQPTRAA